VVAFIATRMLAHHSPGSNKAYQEALRKLVKHLPEPLKALALQSIAALDKRPPSLSGANLETLTQGWLERRVVAFEYRIPGQRPFTVELEIYFIEVSRANMAVYSSVKTACMAGASTTATTSKPTSSSASSAPACWT